MITYSKYEKIYENLDELTQMYSKLVETAKKFEQLLGEDDIATTNLMTAISKLNELILKYKPSGDELIDSSVQELTDVDGMDDVNSDDFGAQDGSQLEDETSTQDETQFSDDDFSSQDETQLEDETQNETQNETQLQ